VDAEHGGDAPGRGDLAAPGEHLPATDVYDLWADQWRKREATGAVIVVRYADDTIVGFKRQAEAERFLRDLRERLAKFGLALHPDKTRLIEFGRFAAQQRSARGLGKPETFDLGILSPTSTVFAPAPPFRPRQAYRRNASRWILDRPATRAVAGYARSL